MLFTIAWVKGAAERAIKTFAQSLLGGIIVISPVVEQPWLPVLGVAATSTIVSILTSVIAANFTAGAQPEPAPGE